MNNYIIVPFINIGIWAEWQNVSHTSEQEGIGCALRLWGRTFQKEALHSQIPVFCVRGCF